MSFRESLSKLRSLFYRPVMSRRSAIVFLSMSMIFVIALFMRLYPALYGWYLNEFDPYFDYYASLHVVTLAQQHGLYYALFNNPPNCAPSALASTAACHSQQGYFFWHDIQTWWPYGRDVAASSQDGLQLTGALTYLFFNGVLHIPISYYDYLVFFPVIVGSLTCIALYFLVKKITNGAGGIFAALLFAVSPPILERGNLGWFKSEPLSLFVSVIASYFFLTMYNARLSTKGLVTRGAIAGALFGYAIISWGGGDQYILIFSLIFLIAPFIKSIDLQRTAYGGSIMVGLLLLISAATPRPGISELTSIVGLSLLASWGFTLVASALRKYGDSANYNKNLIKVLLIFVFGGLIALAFGTVGGVSGRYLTVIDSLYRQTNPLVASVAEQAIPTGSQYFTDYAVLILLGGFGAYAALRRKGIESVFALVLGITGVYVASSFARLMVYSTLAFGVLAAIGLVEISEAILRPTVSSIARKKSRIYEARSEVKVVFAVFMILLISMPVFIPANTWAQPSAAYDLSHSGFFASANTPVSVANGATAFTSSSQDWFQAFQWIRQTPTDSTFVAWWDYGYWIAVMGNRTSLADNATINETQIAQIGRVLVSSPHTSMQLLRAMHSPTYILIFIAGFREALPSQTGGPGTIIYTLTVPTPYPSPSGGDESKKQWFIRIGNTTCGCLEETVGPQALMYPDDFTPTPYFWSNSTLGQLIPLVSTNLYGSAAYFAGNTQAQPSNGYSSTYLPSNGNVSGINAGYTDIFEYQMKMPAGNSSAPFELAFESSSLPGTSTGFFSSVLIYKINYNSTI
jgi:dolichyl-diphosphooligosaccharide--protein glycosyltransferase